MLTELTDVRSGVSRFSHRKFIELWRELSNVGALAYATAAALLAFVARYRPEGDRNAHTPTRAVESNNPTTVRPAGR